ncbi:acyltransferase [Empedobacter falsenii]
MIKALLRSVYYRYLNKIIIYFFPIKGKNNTIDNKNFIPFFSKRIIGNNNKIILLKGSYNKLNIFIKGDNNIIEINKNIRIKDLDLWIEDNNCKIIIGANTTIESAHIGVAEDNSTVSIGKDCMLSSNIRIVTTDSHSIIDNSTGLRLNLSDNVNIGNHVWLGANVCILKGSYISDNSIVGINSIVNKNFKKSNVILAGQPAKIIKEDINWDRERI